MTTQNSVIVGIKYWLQKEFKIIVSETREMQYIKKSVCCIFICMHGG